MAEREFPDVIASNVFVPIDVAVEMCCDCHGGDRRSCKMLESKGDQGQSSTTLADSNTLSMQASEVLTSMVGVYIAEGLVVASGACR